MDALQFAYWLQGFAELNGAAPNAAQWQSITEHLNTVFVKVTPAVTVVSVSDILHKGALSAPVVSGFAGFKPSDLAIC